VDKAHLPPPAYASPARVRLSPDATPAGPDAGAAHPFRPNQTSAPAESAAQAHAANLPPQSGAVAAAAPAQRDDYSAVVVVAHRPAPGCGPADWRHSAHSPLDQRHPVAKGRGSRLVAAPHRPQRTSHALAPLAEAAAPSVESSTAADSSACRSAGADQSAADRRAAEEAASLRTRAPRDCSGRLPAALRAKTTRLPVCADAPDQSRSQLAACPSDSPPAPTQTQMDLQIYCRFRPTHPACSGQMLTGFCADDHRNLPTSRLPP
jgi:hypothetical protein